MAVLPHGNPAYRGTLLRNLLLRQNAAFAWLRPLRELDFNHLDLREGQDCCRLLVVEPAFGRAAAKLRGTNLIKDVAASFHVVRRQRALARAHVAPSQARA